MSLKSSKKVDTNRYELAVSVDKEAFAAACDTAFKKNSKKMSIPGFRKGKAPRHLIEKMYGKDCFYEDALEALYPTALQQAEEEAKLEIVDFSDIKFDLVSMDENGVEFTVQVTVKPEIEIGEYKGLKATKPAVEVTEADVASEIERMRERASSMITVADRAAAEGDTVVFDFDGYVDGTAFEGGKAESYSLKLGSGQFIPGFEEQIVGHNTDDEFDVTVTFPKDYQAEELAGKEAVFKCKLHEIKARLLPELDDEFAKDVSEFDTLEALREDISKKALERKQADADREAESQVIEALIADFKGEIPKAMIDTKINENVRDFEYSLQMQGLNIQQYLKYMNMELDALKENYREQSEKQIKVRLALEKVAELENIVPTEEDIEKQYAEYAENYKMEVEKIKQAIPEKELVKDLAVKKASELVQENAKITFEAKAEKKPAAKKTAAKKPAAKKTAAKTPVENTTEESE